MSKYACSIRGLKSHDYRLFLVQSTSEREDTKESSYILVDCVSRASLSELGEKLNG